MPLIQLVRLFWALCALVLVFGFAPRARADQAVHAMVTEVAQREGVPPRLFHAIIQVESRYRCHAVASDGKSVGIAQVRPRTAASVGVHGPLSDCRNSLTAGARYLAIALRRAGGRWGGAATLYNRGVGARPSERTAYARKVLAAL